MGGICTKQPLVKCEHVLGNSVKNQMEKLDTKEDIQIFKKTSQMSYRSEKYQIINDDEIEDNNYFEDKSSSDEDRILNLKDNRIPESETNTSVWYNPKYNFEYIKGEYIGSGKLGRVYSGLSLNTGEIVAIKCVTLDLKKDIEKQILDINEAVYNIGQLNHKNIIKYLSTQPSSNNPDEIEVISEFCNGGSIKQILEKFDVLDEKLIKLYVKQILEGLVYLHERKIIHRNIRNCNILIDGNGTVKLSDFVVSKILMGNDPDAILSYNTNAGLEPPYWTSPEIINKNANLTTAVDIWSLGCIIIEMATKNPPWSNVSTDCQHVLNLIANSKAPPKFPSHVSKNLKSFLTFCLQHDPYKRPSAKELLKHKFFDLQEVTLPNKFGYEMNKKQQKDYKLINLNPKVESVTRFTISNNYSGESQKLLKNLNLQILDKENKNEEKEKNLINIIGKDSGGGAYFSVSMTVYSQQSQIHEIFNAIRDSKSSSDTKDLKEFKKYPSKSKESEKISEVFYDQEFSPLINNNNIQNNFFKFNSLVTNNNFPDITNESTDSIQKLIEVYNLNDFDFSKIDNIEKLSTLEINKDDLQKLEAFFKDRNNRHSIEPIENNIFDNFLHKYKPI